MHPTKYQTVKRLLSYADQSNSKMIKFIFEDYKTQKKYVFLLHKGKNVDRHIATNPKQKLAFRFVDLTQREQ